MRSLVLGALCALLLAACSTARAPAPSPSAGPPAPHDDKCNGPVRC
jgi:hypothetical protein